VCDSVDCTTRRVERLGDRCIDYYLLALWELVLRLLARARVICTRAMEPATLQVSTSFCLTLALQFLAQASKQLDRNPMLLFPLHYLLPRVGIPIPPSRFSASHIQAEMSNTCPTESAEHGDLEVRLEESGHIFPFSVPTSVRVSSAVFWEVLLFGFRSAPCSALFCKG
jgi:hypothetical protein